jgi:APA family basic amino acid/polyamine antiporter
VPHRAEPTAAGIVVVLVLTTDLRGAIGSSSFGAVLYDVVPNAAAFRQRAGERRFPRWLQMVGMSGCLVLVATLPWEEVLVSAVPSSPRASSSEACA